MQEHFKTKKSACEFMRGLLDNHTPNTPLENDDLIKALSVLKRHPQFHEKAGVYPYQIITIDITYMGKKQRCFAIQNLDGDIVDISYNVALSANPEKLVYGDNTTAAARLEIAEDILQVRLDCSDKKGIICHICDKEINGDLHIDHLHTPFRDILSDFLRYKGVSEIETIDVEPTGRRFSCRDTANEWVEYHHARASYGYAHARCNIQKG